MEGALAQTITEVRVHKRKLHDLEEKMDQVESQAIEALCRAKASENEVMDMFDRMGIDRIPVSLEGSYKVLRCSMGSTDVPSEWSDDD